MAITKLPYKVQPAFNDVLVEVENEDILSLYWMDEHGNLRLMTLTRELINNKARYNLSGILRGIFDSTLKAVRTSKGLSWLFNNGRLYKGYGLNNSFLQYFAVNAVQKRGERLNLGQNNGRDVLTARKVYWQDNGNALIKLPRYHGYPVEICFLFKPSHQDFSIYIDTGAIMGFDSFNPMAMEESIVVCDILIDKAHLLEDYEKIIQIRLTVPTNTISCQLIDKCIPDHPIYLRWVNRFGGYEYWMFSGRKVFGEDVKRGESYLLGDGQGIDSTATRGELAPTVDNTIACGAEQLEEWEFSMLKGIFLSPYVEMYNVERNLFEKVILKDSAAEWDTANSRGVIDIEFSTIDQPIQF